MSLQEGKGRASGSLHCDSLVRMRSLLPALNCKQRQGVHLTKVSRGRNLLRNNRKSSEQALPTVKAGAHRTPSRSSYTLPCLAGSTPGFCCIFVLFPPNTGKTCVDAVDWLSLGQVSHLIRRLGQGTFRLTSRLREL